MARGIKKTTDDRRQTTDGGPEHYRRTMWKRGELNYECVHCAFATLEPLKMADHLRVVHGVLGGTAPAVERGMPIILAKDDEVKE